MKTNKSAFNVWGVLFVGLWVPILYLLFYIPYDEYIFLRKIESSFSKTDSKTFKIKEITDFDWDAVCVFSQYNILPPTLDETALAQAFEETYKYDYKNVKGYLPSRWSPAFWGAFLFIHDGKVIKTLTYDTWGLRYSTAKGWHRYYLKLNTSGTEAYFTEAYFLDEAATLNDGCINREDAAFIKHSYGKDYVILATNLKKDKD